MTRATTAHFKFRDYQVDIIRKGTDQVKAKGWCYLAMEVRTGKTLTSLGIAQNIGGRVCFVTKKKAISSIENDIALLGSDNIHVEVINYESVHKVNKPSLVDIWILDEAHKLGAFPKPSQRTKKLRSMIKGDVIFLSGTPTPESISQIFHQMWVLGDRSPFARYRNFYRWSDAHCNVYEIDFGYAKVKQYDKCHFDVAKLNFLSYSQKEAGFKNTIREHFLEVEMNEQTKELIKRLKRDKVIMGKTEDILADTGAKEMSKVHQLSSGTVKFESGNTMIVDWSKARFIANYFKGKKIAIFYKFKAELEMLSEVFDVTQDVEEFNNTEKVICLQFVSGREGIKLNQADCLVFLNIDFSATTYFQARDRMTTIDRKESDVYYIVSDCGIEREVYKAVQNKKDYTLRHYERTRLPA